MVSVVWQLCPRQQIPWHGMAEVCEGALYAMGEQVGSIGVTSHHVDCARRVWQNQATVFFAGVASKVWYGVVWCDMAWQGRQGWPKWRRTNDWNGHLRSSKFGSARLSSLADPVAVP